MASIDTYDNLMQRYTQVLPEGWQLSAPLILPIRQIAVDTELLTHGCQVDDVRLPLTAQPAFERKPSSSSLLMGAAAVLLADLFPAEHAGALLDFAQALRFHPENFRKSRPVLSDLSLDGMPGRIVRDGAGQRAYFAGRPAALLSQCSLIWDGQPRPVQPADHAALPDGDDRYAFATAAVTPDGLKDITYLGSVNIIPAPNRPLRDALHRLQDEGFSVVLLGHDGPLNNDTLCVTCEPDAALCLIPPRHDDPHLADAVQAVTRLYQHLEQQYRRQRRRYWLSLLLTVLLASLGLGFLLLIHIENTLSAAALILLSYSFASCCGILLFQPQYKPRWLFPLLALSLLLGIAAALMLEPVTAAFAAITGLLASIVLLSGILSGNHS